MHKSCNHNYTRGNIRCPDEWPCLERGWCRQLQAIFSTICARPSASCTHGLQRHRFRSCPLMNLRLCALNAPQPHGRVLEGSNEPSATSLAAVPQRLLRKGPAARAPPRLLVFEDIDAIFGRDREKLLADSVLTFSGTLNFHRLAHAVSACIACSCEMPTSYIPLLSMRSAALQAF